ncbi:MAG: translocation/assembly module TamB domain-containing protein [Gammaproteobacteria bacterium]|nr:translocation/assembly module TamB domain-containing protein [Gammaproteobacteria bacterium]
MSQFQLGRRFFRYLAISLILVILCCIALIASHWGNRLLISTISKIAPNISLNLDQGSLVNDPTITNLSVKLAGLSLSIRHIELNWNWRCIIDSGVCIEKMVIEGVNVDITKTNQPQETTANSHQPIELPIWLQVSAITINNFSLSIDGHQIQWQDLALAITLKGSRFTIDDLTLKQLIVTLANAEKTEQQTQKRNSQPITLPEITLPIAVVINRLHLIDSTIISNDQPQKIKDITLDLTAQESHIAIKNFQMDHQLANVALQGNIRLHQQYPLNFTTTITTKEPAKLGINTLSLLVNGQLNNLNIDASSLGQLNTKLAGSLNLLEPTLPFDLTANWQDLTLPDQPLNIQSGDLQFKGSLAKFNYQINGGVASSDIPMSTFKMIGYGSRDDLIIEQLVVKTLNGEISTTANINWQQNLSWQAQLSLDNIQPQTHWPQLDGLINGQLASQGSLDNKQWQVELNKINLTGQWLKQALKVTGKIKGQSNNQAYGQWVFNQVTAVNGQNSVIFNGKIDQNFDLNAQVDIKDLAQSLPEVAANIQAKLMVTGSVKSPVITFNMTARDIDVPSLNIAANIISAQGKLHRNEIANNSVAINIEQLSLEQQKIQRANINFSGSWQQHVASLVINGSPISAQLSLDGKYHNNRWQGAISPSVIDTPIGVFGNSHTIELAYNNLQQQLLIAAHCWSQQTTTATLCLPKASKVGVKGSLHLAVNNFNLDSLDSLLSEQKIKLLGLTNIQIDAQWQPNEKPSLAAKFSSEQGRLSMETLQGEFLNHYQNLDATLVITSQNSSLNFTISSPEIGEISLTAQNDIFTPLAPLTGEIKLSAIKLGAFDKLFSEIDTLNGLIDGRSNIGGSLKDPLFFGEFKLSDANVTGLLLPTQLEQLTANISLKGHRAQLTSQLMLGQGKTKIIGSVDWGSQLIAQLNIVGDHISIIPSQDIAIVLSPNLYINYLGATEGINEQLVIAGQLSIDQGKIKIKELPESAVSLSDDVQITRSGVVEKPNKMALSMALDLSIKDKVFIDAFGLTSYLSGNLALAQGPNTPLSGHGELNLVKAKYIAMGQNLNIRQGKLLFNGSLAQPFLNVEAIRDPKLTQDNVIAGINVTGSIKQPKLVIFSEPVMSQQEALFYLLRGRGIDSEDTSSRESMIIGMLLSTGFERSGNLINNLGKQIGITDMSLNTTGTGDNTAVEVSGYLSPNVEVRYSVGVFDSQPQLTIRYQIIPRLFVDIIKGTDEALDLLYQFDFD